MARKLVIPGATKVFRLPSPKTVILNLVTVRSGTCKTKEQQRIFARPLSRGISKSLKFIDKRHMDGQV
jgi:hypothetical protein